MNDLLSFTEAAMSRELAGQATGDPSGAIRLSARLHEPHRCDADNRSIQDRFEDFHRRHPEVLAKLVELAREVKSRGKRCGIRTLWEKMRWAFEIERDADDEFKLNDHYHSRYVRLIVDTLPHEFDGFFELRKLKAE